MNKYHSHPYSLESQLSLQKNTNVLIPYFEMVPFLFYQFWHKAVNLDIMPDIE